MSDEIDYHSDDEWARCVPDGLLAGIDDEDLALLHRHFIWANRQRTLFDGLLVERGGTPRDDSPDDDEPLAGDLGSTMLLWYSLLWSVIEAFDDRNLQLGGHLKADIDAISDILRRCRNAVLHVPKRGEYHDQRIIDVLTNLDFVARIRRINTGFGRLFLEEMRGRAGDG